MARTRYTKSVIKSAKTCDVVLPWTRGARRRAFIAKRQAPISKLKSA